MSKQHPAVSWIWDALAEMFDRGQVKIVSADSHLIIACPKEPFGKGKYINVQDFCDYLDAAGWTGITTEFELLGQTLLFYRNWLPNAGILCRQLIDLDYVAIVSDETGATAYQLKDLRLDDIWRTIAYSLDFTYVYGRPGYFVVNQ